MANINGLTQKEITKFQEILIKANFQQLEIMKQTIVDMQVKRGL